MHRSEEMLEVAVWRGNGKSGGYVSYPVPIQDNQTVLDVVTWIQQRLEPDLSYRFSCRVGMCGSCAMMVNGKPRWTCRTHVQKVIDGNALSIAPLRNLPVIKDLVCDMAVFFDKWLKAEGVFHPTATREDAVAPIPSDNPARITASAAIECINCAVCYAACDVVAMIPDYLGPAGLNRAWTLINDQRDGAQSARLQAVSADGGCFNCHAQQGCSVFCPMELNPTHAIAGLKRAAVKAALTRRV